MNDTSDTSVLKVKTNDCSFDNNNVRSREYDDIFFQKDGIDESKYVFFDQNNIQEKFDKLKPYSSFTIGVPEEFTQNLNEDVKKTFYDSIKVFENMGCKIKSISLKYSSLGVSAYQVVAPAECSSNLSRFDGVRYGHRSKNSSNLEDLYRESRSEGFGKEVKRRILVGTYALSAGYYDAYYLKAQKVRKLIAQDFKNAFDEVDLIMGPTTPDKAFKIGEKMNDPIAMYLSDVYTVSTNLAGLPAMSLPMGFKDGLPLGLQIIGNHFDEKNILKISYFFQRETDWHTKEPEA